MSLLAWKTYHVFVVNSMVCLLIVTIVTSAATGLADDSGEAAVEVPEAVTVEIEEIHPLPEVSAVTTNTILNKL